MRRYNEGYHFVTLVVNSRIPIFQIEHLAYTSIDTLNFYYHRKDYDLLGYVVMPDHIHFLCATQRPISEIVRDIKKYIAKEAVAYLTQNRPELLGNFKMASPGKRGHVYQIWQKDFYDFNITSDSKFLEKLKYMYQNPLRKELCQNVLDYKFSDARRYFGSGDPKLPGVGAVGNRGYRR